jgi:hypothetical protein
MHAAGQKFDLPAGGFDFFAGDLRVAEADVVAQGTGKQTGILLDVIEAEHEFDDGSLAMFGLCAGM